MTKKRDIPSENNKVLAQTFRKKALQILTSSALTARSAIASKMGKSFGGKRDLYTALGYPGLNELKFEHYYAEYLRHDIAGRLIDAPVDGAWEQKPTIKDLKETDESPFEKEWKTFIHDHGVWGILTRLDKLARIGQFGGLFIGFDDAENAEGLRQPVQAGQRKVLYLQPYGQGNLEIIKWYTDVHAANYGLPEIYKVNQKLNGTSGAVNSTIQALEIHESRIIHIAEGTLESNLYGQPALQRVYNRLINLETIVGGSAEMFWQGAFPGYAFVADGDTDMTQAATELEGEIDLFVHDLKRYMKLQGIKVEKLSSDVADPSSHVEVQLTMISVATGIPIRILTGSERGSLASEQDEGHWNDKLHSRRIDYLEPAILRPFINRLVEYKVISDPGTDGYIVDWPDLNAPTDKDKAEIGKIRAEAIKAYIDRPEIQLILTFESFLLDIMRLDETVVKKIMEKAEESVTGMLGREE